MIGLVNRARSSGQNVSYFAKTLRMRMELRITNLNFLCGCLKQVMNTELTGGVIGSSGKIVVYVDLLLDFNKDKIHLQQFSMSDIRCLRVQLTGNILTDWLVNPIIGIFVRVFDDVIVSVVETNIRCAMQDVFNTINTNTDEVITVFKTFD